MTIEYQHAPSPEFCSVPKLAPADMCRGDSCVGAKGMPPEPPLDDEAGDRLLRPKEAARFLSVGVKTLANWRVSGLGPYYVKMGLGPRSRIRYSLRELRRWRDENSRRSTS